MQAIYIAVGNQVIDTFDDTVHSEMRTHNEANIEASILNFDIALAAWRAAKQQRKTRANELNAQCCGRERLECFPCYKF